MIFFRLQDTVLAALRLYFEPLRWVSDPLSQWWRRVLLLSSPRKLRARRQFIDLSTSSESRFNFENDTNLILPAPVYRSLAWMALSTDLRRNWGIAPTTTTEGI